MSVADNINNSLQSDDFDGKNAAQAGSFVALLSQEDDSTPFWIAQVPLSSEQKSGSAIITVRWYQASGSASDPYDAIYTPVRHKRSINSDANFWESKVQLSEVIFVFESLTEDNRLGEDTVHGIKKRLCD